MEYTIEVKTGSRKWNETDSNVKLSIVGDNNVIKDAPLKESLTHKDSFERAQVDKFVLQGPVLGDIQSVTLASDKSGKGASWYVLWVKVRYNADISKDGDEEVIFHFNNWFSNKSGWTHTVEQGLTVRDFKPVEGHTSQHHTFKFQQNEEENEKKRIFIRRADSIQFNMTLQRPIAEKLSFDLVFTLGKRARESTNTLVVVKCQLDDKAEYGRKEGADEWAGRIVRAEGKEIFFQVYIPSTAIVGAWTLAIEYKDSLIHQVKEDIVLLFNPWKQRDEVYMNSEDDLKEYVIRQNGIVYQGNGSRPHPKRWYFGQFESVVTEAMLHLLDRIPLNKRSSAVHITRCFSSLINSLDNEGVLEGNWSGNYEDGHSPSFWSTSPLILEKYIDDGFQPVKYGQCWVFSAITVTLMRVLGIPCRSVTNFDSAHDTDANVTHDIYFDADGKYDKERTNDSVWNFHVWNDVFMRRTDLDANGTFDGWQAIDATPQELSSNIYQMGPSPLSAIKQGRVDQPYDTKFAFAEVNAETLHWKTNGKNQDVSLMRRLTDRVGHSISTKKVGSNWRHDITDEYKFQDGTIIESASVRTALKLVQHKILESDVPALEVSIVLQSEEVFVGKPVAVVIEISNQSTEDMSVTVKLSSQLIEYTGEIVHYLRSNDADTRKIKIGKQSVSKIHASVEAKEYVPFLRADQSLQVHATAVGPNKQVAVGTVRVQLLKPQIKMEVLNPDTKISGTPFKVQVSFENPLDVPLKYCRAYFGGAILRKAIYDNSIPDVDANGRFVKVYDVTPYGVDGKLVTKSLVYSFSCHPIGGLSETIDVQVSSSENA